MATKPICKIDGCNKPYKGHGLCPMHLRRFRLYGDPLKTKCTPTGSLIAWIRDHASYAGNECLTWPFGCNADGRPTIHFEGRQQLAARVMCIIAHGPPPFDGAECAHECGNGHLGCMNQTHLRWDTRTGNQRDRKAHNTCNSGNRNGMSRFRINARLKEMT